MNMQRGRSGGTWLIAMLGFLAAAVLLCLTQWPGLTAVAADPAPAVATGPAYYIDFDSGKDTADGHTPDTAFKHCPGDAKATDNAAKAQPRPGERVIFKGGVVYRGAIVISASGQEGQPLVYDGNTAGQFGRGRAIIDGSEPVSDWRRCASSADCDGNPAWQRIYYALLPGTVKPGSANLCEGDKLLWLAQDPHQPDPFYMDKVEHFYKIANKSVTRTTITDPQRLNQKDEHCWDDAYVMIWTRPNVVAKRKITKFIPAECKITFDQAGDPYDDREEFYTLYNSLHLLNQPGAYVLRAKPESDGRLKAFLWPLAEADLKAGQVTVSVRTCGFNANGTSHVTIQGFQIQKFSGAVQFEGIGVRGERVADLTVRNNVIIHLRHAERGYGGVYLSEARDCLIEGNQIGESPLSMGILVGGGSTNIVTRGNTVRKAGGQSIWYMECKNSKIIGNEVRDGQGTHANGISVYHQCDGVEVLGNRVFDSNIPFTFEESQNVTIAGNVFDGGGVNWGCVCWSNMDHVKIFNNVFLNVSEGAGLVIRNTKGKDFVVKNNIMAGFAARPEWDVSHNIYTGHAEGQGKLRAGEFTEPNLNRLFVDAARKDFRLRPGSPAIGAGVDVGLKEDAVGAKVPQGRAPDIGAYEFKP